MSPIMTIDPAAVSLSKRIAGKTGRRASEIYKYAAPLLKQDLTTESVEKILTDLCDVGEGLPLDEIMELAFEGTT